eukprot:g1600.t1
MASTSATNETSLPDTITPPIMENNNINSVEESKGTTSPKKSSSSSESIPYEDFRVSILARYTLSPEESKAQALEVERTNLRMEVNPNFSDKRQKKRKREDQGYGKKTTFEDFVCPNIRHSGDPRDCRYGDKCKFSHDVKSFISKQSIHSFVPNIWTKKLMNNCQTCLVNKSHSDLVLPKLPDGYKCPLFELEGHCRFGLNCVYLHAHLPKNLQLPNLSSFESNDAIKKNNNQLPGSKVHLKDGSNSTLTKSVVVTTTIDSSKVKPTTDAKVSENQSKKCSTVFPSSILNTLSNGTLKALRKRKYKFKLSENSLQEKPTNEKTVRRIIDFKNKIYIAPLTTVGNLPYRRVMCSFGADITCGEMALATPLLQGKQSEWALLKRHSSEKIFGVQLAGAYGDQMKKVATAIIKEFGPQGVDFIDVNGMGSALMQPHRHKKLYDIVESMGSLSNTVPITVKMRRGWSRNINTAKEIIDNLYKLDRRQWAEQRENGKKWSGIGAVTIHGRSRQQRYKALADWNYIRSCTKDVSFDKTITSDQTVNSSDACHGSTLPIIGNGDIYSYTDWKREMEFGQLTTCMLARGALIKPWLPTEIKESRHWDISATERFDILKEFCNYGLCHWGRCRGKQPVLAKTLSNRVPYQFEGHAKKYTSNKAASKVSGVTKEMKPLSDNDVVVNRVLSLPPGAAEFDSLSSSSVLMKHKCFSPQYCVSKERSKEFSLRTLQLWGTKVQSSIDTSVDLVLQNVSTWYTTDECIPLHLFIHGIFVVLDGDVNPAKVFTTALEATLECHDLVSFSSTDEVLSSTDQLAPLPPGAAEFDTFSSLMKHKCFSPQYCVSKERSKEFSLRTLQLWGTKVHSSVDTSVDLVLQNVSTWYTTDECIPLHLFIHGILVVLDRGVNPSKVFSIAIQATLECNDLVNLTSNHDSLQSKKALVTHQDVNNKMPLSALRPSTNRQLNHKSVTISHGRNQPRYLTSCSSCPSGKTCDIIVEAENTNVCSGSHTKITSSTE